MAFGEETESDFGKKEFDEMIRCIDQISKVVTTFKPSIGMTALVVVNRLAKGQAPGLYSIALVTGEIVFDRVFKKRQEEMNKDVRT